MKRNLIICIIPLLVFSLKVFPQSNKVAKVRLEMPKRTFNNFREMEIKLSIEAKRTLCLPVQTMWNYLEDPVGYYLIKVEKKDSGGYRDIPRQAHMDNPPAFDIDTLAIHGRRSFLFEIGALYRYTPGEYRVRVLCKFSLSNPFEDQYSNWVYFSCEKGSFPE